MNRILATICLVFLVAGVSDFIAHEYLEAGFKIATGGLLVFAVYMSERIPLAIYGVILLLTVFSYPAYVLWANHNADAESLKNTNHHNDAYISRAFPCEVGEGGVDKRCDVSCVCKCGSYAKGLDEQIYDRKNMTGCMSTYWMCSSRPCGTITKISD